MGSSFDFNKIERKYLNVTLPAPDNTILIVKMPKKNTFEKMKVFQSMDEETLDIELLYDTLDELIAEILSNNKAGKKITTKYVAENEELDFEAKMSFISQYMDFVNNTSADPN